MFLDDVEYITITTVEADAPEYTLKWIHPQTLMLLDLYREYRQWVGTLAIRNLRKMYEVISERIKAEIGANVTASQCVNIYFSFSELL